MRRLLVLLGCGLAVLTPAGAAHAGQVKAGAAVLDGSYHVGSSAGQYASTRDGGYGNADPHLQSVKNMASYGVQSRESVRALVVKGADGKIVALVSDDHYIPQDALFKRTAQLLEASTGGAIGAKNLTMTVTHNHSSPSYSSLNPGVWTFQDAFDFRFFDYYARQNAAAVKQAYENLHDVRVSATVSRFDKIQRNPLGDDLADDGTPAGFTSSYSDHDLSVVRFENVDRGVRHAQPLATLVNLGQHPEFLNGYDLITSEFPGAMERMVDRTVGGVTIFTQNATGNSEIEQETYHGVHEREAFNHTQYNQMEWAARQLADGVIADVREIEAQRPNADDASHFGMTSYHDRFVGWMRDFPVGIQDVWFPGPVSHPVPGVNSCRTDKAFEGNPRIGTAADCSDVPIGESLQPLTGALPFGNPGISTDTFEALGLPVPENVSTPSHALLEDTVGVHLQAFRLGEILFTVCSCEQWTDQAYNIKTRTDTKPGNEWLGYDATDPPKDDVLWERNVCTPNDDGSHSDDGSGTGTWSCTARGGAKVADRPMARHVARTRNDAAGWDDPACAELGCGLQAESEPTDLAKIRGNYTHDDTTVRGGQAQSADYAARNGFRLVVTISMANDYNGYIATYRDYMGRDHYRKALTGWGPHSSDYMATRLVRLGHALKGDAASQAAIDREADPAKAAPPFLPGALKVAADQAKFEAQVRGVGEASTAAAQAYDKTLPDDGVGAPGDVEQPKSIERFDATTFTWVGGNNYTDNPEVTVERRVDGRWIAFGDQRGEIQTSLAYPSTDPSGVVTYRAGGQVWKWTASFEAMVNRFALVDPQGRAYRATPAGTYRFVVEGKRRAGNADAPYAITSDTFAVRPWSGITVEDARVDDERRAFSAGPRHERTEGRIRGTTRPDFGAQTFTIGPVDYPDFATDQKATGFAFLGQERGYSAAAEGDASQTEHYCLDCRFRDWLDATGELRATITYDDGRAETLTTTDGTFRADRRLRGGASAEIVIRDRWGNRSAARTVRG